MTSLTNLSKRSKHPGGRPVDEQVEAVAFAKFGQDKGDSVILRELQAEFGSKAPSVARTIARWRDRYEKLDPLERAGYERVRWPDSLAQPGLPLEASVKVLALLRHHQERGWSVPTVRKAKWFYKLSVAAPDAPFETCEYLAAIASAHEALAKPGDTFPGALQFYLAFEAWRPPNKAAYETASAGREFAPAFALMRDAAKYIERRESGEISTQAVEI